MKRKIFRRVFAVIFAVIISAMCFTAAFAVNSGDCGSDVEWSFDEATGELVISGSGTMSDYDKADDAPWYSFKDSILKITVSEGVTGIGRYAFNSCTKVSEISLPEGLKTIGYSSFDSCSSLKSISIPASVKKLNASPFFNCTALETITVEESSKYYCTDNEGVLYNKDKTELIQYPCGRKAANFIIPFTVTTINQAAFAGSEMIVNVIIPESTTTIDSMAFYGCSSLKIVTIPKSVEMIGEKAFYDCFNLAEVYYTGTEEQWSSVSIRNDNELLNNATFAYETKGPESVPENTQNDLQQTTSTTQPSTGTMITKEQVAEKREYIPIILIGIGVIVLILFIILIRVIVKRNPDDKD